MIQKVVQILATVPKINSILLMKDLQPIVQEVIQQIIHINVHINRNAQDMTDRETTIRLRDTKDPSITAAITVSRADIKDRSRAGITDARMIETAVKEVTTKADIKDRSKAATIVRRADTKDPSDRREEDLLWAAENRLGLKTDRQNSCWSIKNNCYKLKNCIKRCFRCLIPMHTKLSANKSGLRQERCFSA